MKWLNDFQQVLCFFICWPIHCLKAFLLFVKVDIVGNRRGVTCNIISKPKGCIKVPPSVKWFSLKKISKCNKIFKKTDTSKEMTFETFMYSLFLDKLRQDCFWDGILYFFLFLLSRENWLRCKIALKLWISWSASVNSVIMDDQDNENDAIKAMKTSTTG